MTEKSVAGVPHYGERHLAKVIDIQRMENMLKADQVKLSGIMELPWFLKYSTRGLCESKIQYLCYKRNNTFRCIPLVLFRKGFVRVCYIPLYETVVVKHFNFGRLLRILGVDAVIIRLYPCSSPLPLLDSKFVKIKDKTDLCINLDDGIVNIYRNFEKRHRYSLRKALRMGDNQLLEETRKDPFYGGIIYEQSCERGLVNFAKLLKIQLEKITNKHKASSLMLSDLRSYYSLRNLKRVFDILRNEGLIRIFFARGRDGVPECGIALFVSRNYVYKPMVYWWLGASTSTAEMEKLPTVLQWSVMNLLKNEGYSRYWLGGIGEKIEYPSPGFFKRGFDGNYCQGYLLALGNKAFDFLIKVMAFLMRFRIMKLILKVVFKINL